MRVNVCGITHEVKEVPTTLANDGSLGAITYATATIEINEEASDQIKKETIIHEMMHGILVHIGRDELASDETFVQSLANAVYQSFEVKEV